MKKWLLLVLSLLVIVRVAKGQSQPSNFMVAELTFQRPSAWKWIDVSGENEKARLYIFDKALNEKAIVSFELVNAHPVPSFVDKWTEPFLSQTPAPEVRLQTNIVNHYRVVTVDITGSKVVNKLLATNQLTHGVIIEIKGEEIGARILGAKIMVDKLEPVFTRTIKEALQPEE